MKKTQTGGEKLKKQIPLKVEETKELTSEILRAAEDSLVWYDEGAKRLIKTRKTGEGGYKKDER
jgi:hypothetical protein